MPLFGGDISVAESKNTLDSTTVRVELAVLELIVINIDSIVEGRFAVEVGCPDGEGHERLSQSLHGV